MNLTESYQDAWGAYIALRKLGFPDDTVDIQCALIHRHSPDGARIESSKETWLITSLLVDKMLFYIPIAALPGVTTEEEGLAHLKDCHALRESLGQDGLELYWKASRFGSQVELTQLGQVLQTAGFQIPAWMN